MDLEHLHVTANGLRMHVAACGPANGQPVVFLHGFPEGWMSWRAVMQRLGEHYRCYAPDLRGYGETDKPADGYDVVSLTDDVVGLVEALRMQSPILVGHDWGGALAWIYGHRFGRSLRHLVVVNCTHPRTLFRGVVQGRAGQHRKSWYMLAFQAPGVPERLMVADHARLLRQGFVHLEGRPGALDRAVVDEICNRFRSAADLRGPVNYYRQYARMLLAPQGRELLRAIYSQAIPCPVSLIWGDRDRALSQELAQESHRDAGRDVAWHPMPGVGHFVSLEAPEALSAEIRAIAEATEITAPAPAE
ncbi:MAG: alpha/beta hydrolase [Deltaproteobacteria bacterium]|nr:alpha/beta hydrolase [Deltaproteobacteria bacterium]